jgi:TolB-like protein
MRITFAGLEMDLLRQELRRDGADVHVEPQVYDLLLHLVRHRDRVVGKDELFDTIWQGRIVSEAALSSRINAARRAIGDDGERQALIRTVHKRGFRFVGEVEEHPDAAGPATGPAAAPESPPTPAPELAASAAPPAPVVVRDRRPSVAVIPFANLSPEPDTEYFAYGLTEDVIRLLARHRWLDVLTRHSALEFRDRHPAEPRIIAAALGVRYVVRGTVLKRGAQVRIAADLLCGETGRHLWSETYDLGLDDLLPVQEAMAQQIAAAIEPELSRLEQEAAMRRPPSTMDAWDCYQRGLYHLWGFSTPALADGQAMFRRAIALDPGFARAHGALAYVLLQTAFVSGPEGRDALLAEALESARTAVALDDRDCMNLCVLGRVHCLLRDQEESITLLEQCVALNPSFAQGWFALAFTLTWSGRGEEAVALVERAAELSPRDPHLTSFLHLRALAYFTIGELEGAATYARMAVRLANASQLSFATLAATLGLLGRAEAARAATAALLQRRPGHTCRAARDALFFCTDAAFLDRYVEGLRRAGLPDGPGEAPAPGGAGGAGGRRRGQAAAAPAAVAPASRSAAPRSGMV